MSYHKRTNKGRELCLPLGLLPSHRATSASCCTSPVQHDELFHSQKIRKPYVIAHVKSKPHVNLFRFGRAWLLIVLLPRRGLSNKHAAALRSHRRVSTSCGGAPLPNGVCKAGAALRGAGERAALKLPPLNLPLLCKRYFIAELEMFSPPSNPLWGWRGQSAVRQGRAAPAGKMHVHSHVVSPRPRAFVLEELEHPH